MHSFIFQVSNKPLVEAISERSIGNGDMISPIDEATKLGGNMRGLAINDLVTNVLPKGMFTLSQDCQTITYNGGFSLWRKSYLKLLQDRMKAVTEDNIMEWIGPAYQLQKAIVNPLNTDCLFITESFADYGVAERSAEIMRLVSRLNKGDLLYVGTVFDYHF